MAIRSSTFNTRNRNQKGKEFGGFENDQKCGSHAPEPFCARKCFLCRRPFAARQAIENMRDVARDDCRGCGGSLEDELCPDLIERWKVENACPAVCRLTSLSGLITVPETQIKLNCSQSL